MSKRKNTAVDAKSTQTTEAVGSVPAAQEEAASADQNASSLCRVTWVFGLNLRQGPGKDHPVLKVLPFGSTVETRGEPVTINGTDWVSVQNGWADAQYLEHIDGKE